MSETQLPAETAKEQGPDQYSHYNPVKVEVNLHNTLGAVLLALFAVTLLVVLLRMQARQERLLQLLARGEQAGADT